MDRKVVAVGVLVCALVPVFGGTASAGSAGSAAKVLPWATVVRNAQIVCINYDKKLFQLPGLKALQKIKSEKDLTPEVLKNSMVPYLKGEIGLEKLMLTQWNLLGVPREASYRKAWTRWLFLWKTVHIPAAENALAAAERGDAKGIGTAKAPVKAAQAEGSKLEDTLQYSVCQWDD